MNQLKLIMKLKRHYEMIGAKKRSQNFIWLEHIKMGVS